MAKLVIPHIFTPGTPAQASQMNANFDAISNWSLSGQIETDSIKFPLESRSNDNQNNTRPILKFVQTIDEKILELQNAEGSSSIYISQTEELNASTGIIHINDQIAQTESASAAIKLVLSSVATAPAILVSHGTETLSLTKSAFNLFANALQMSGTAVTFFTNAFQASASQLLLFNSAIEMSAARIKLPVRTTTERNAVTQEGSVLYDSTKKELAFRTNTTWIPASTPTGCVQMFAGSTAPQGWLYCNGQAVSRTTYADLFATIGTTYGGGDGATTFNLPNFVGIFPRGAAMGGTTTQAISGVTYTGGSLNDKQLDQFQGHRHRVQNVSTGVNYLQSRIDAVGGGAGSVAAPNAHGGINEGEVHGATINNAINDANGVPRTGNETRPANIAIAYIIKV